MSGGSRGIGLAILTAAVRVGANAVFLARTDTGSEAAGHRTHAAVERYGGADICVDNAGALDVQGTEELPPGASP